MTFVTRILSVTSLTGTNRRATGDVPVSLTPDHLLLESGDALLLESGDYLALETN